MNFEVDSSIEEKVTFVMTESGDVACCSLSLDWPIRVQEVRVVAEN